MEMSPQLEAGLATTETERNVSAPDLNVMTPMMRAINAYAESLPESEILTINSFSHLGRPAEINRAVTGLVKQGNLFHVENEYFVAPLQGMAIKYCPSVKIILQNLGRLTDETFTMAGGTAANDFHLSHHVPIRRIYWTSGPERELKIGKRVIELQHVPEWKLVFPYTKMGDAFRAIIVTGRDHVKDSLRRIKPLFTEDEQRDFTILQSYVKDWLAGEFSKIVECVDTSSIEPEI